MITLIRWFAASGYVALAAALVLAAVRAGDLSDIVMFLIGPAMFVIATAYVAVVRPPAPRARWLLAITGSAWIGSAVAIATTHTGPLGAIGWILMGPTPFLVAATYLLVRSPGERSGWWLTAVALIVFDYPVFLEQIVWLNIRDGFQPPWIAWLLLVASIVSTAGVAALACLIGLFPSGRPRSRAERIAVRVFWAAPLGILLLQVLSPTVITEGVAYGGLEPVANPLYIGSIGAETAVASVWMAFAFAVLVVSGLVMLARRYRAGDDSARRQTRWVLYGAAMTVAIAGTPFIVAAVVGATSVHGPLFAATSASLVFIPASIVFAIRQPRGVDIDSIIRKSLVYGVLSVGIFIVYGAVAAGLGLAAGSRFPIEVAIVLTVVVAVLFQPTRARLQSVADRWVFGERPSAIEAIAGIDDSFGDIALTVADLAIRAARLEWAQVRMDNGPGASVGDVDGEPLRVVPIENNGERFGEIRLGPAVSGSLSEQDLAVIDALAHQAALNAANVELASRLVHAQEAERRRIERNIHDGTQQELVALVAKLGLARSQVKSGSLDESTLLELQEDASAILRDLRDFAQGIHPTVLTDGGLVEALEDRCSRLPIEVLVEFSPGLRRHRFGDDIEGAAYFFVAEGLANVLKHASASTARVEITRENGNLALSVNDDGVGFERSTQPLRGLAGLNDRFAAMSGSMAIESTPGHGTVLTASLPVEDGAR